MRTRTNWAAMALAAAAVAGCVPSLHPLYTNADLIFEPALVGAWVEEESPKSRRDGGAGIWTFIQADEKSYKLVYADKDGKTGEFSAHLLRVEGTLFLDLYPAEPKLTQNDFYKLHLIPAHTFLWVMRIQPTLRIASLNPDWITEFLNKHPSAVRHEKMEDGVVLTAGPKELQKFLLANLKTKDAFDESADLHRQPPAH